MLCVSTAECRVVLFDGFGLLISTVFENNAVMESNAFPRGDPFAAFCGAFASVRRIDIMYTRIVFEC